MRKDNFVHKHAADLDVVLILIDAWYIIVFCDIIA